MAVENQALKRFLFPWKKSGHKWASLKTEVFRGPYKKVWPALATDHGGVKG